jgi:hypothetical protein
VYNSGGHPIKAITLGELVETTLKLNKEIPINGIIWNPNMCTIKNQTWYIANVIFLHLLPGLLIDGLLKICGRKPLYENLHFIIF